MVEHGDNSSLNNYRDDSYDPVNVGVPRVRSYMR